MSGVLALIPARGGSKRLPGKNVRLLAGKPLIAHTIEAARTCPGVDRVVVSTDDADIARVSREAGAEVPFLRPDELATDAAASIDVALHALSWLRETDGWEPQTVVLLQATSPLRHARHVTEALALHRAGDEHAAVVSVVPAKPAAWMLRWEPSHQLAPLFRRGEEPVAPAGGALYLPNGAVYISTPALLAHHRSFSIAGARPYVMPPSLSIDIDTLDDFELAEAVLLRRAASGG